MSRTKISLLAKIVGLVIYFLLIFFISKAQVTSDFSAGADGWTISDNSTTQPINYNSTSGNSGGCVAYTAPLSNTNIYFVSPSKFTGNFSASYNQTLSFDLKVSTTGTDVVPSFGDVVIFSPAGTLVHQLPSNPAAGTWTSYSFQLNETQGWHNGCYNCGAPSQTIMKQSLQTITKIQIRLKYANTSGGYTGQLDNVVLNVQSLGPHPTITSLSPASAVAGSTITITGTNFNSTAAQNVVYFKGIKANVTNATPTQLTVTVPTSAGFGPVSVTDLSTGLQGISQQNFNPLFDNNKDFGGQIIPASMSRGYNTVLPMNSSASNSFGTMDKGDIDGDGWIDFVSTETFTAKLYSFRNLGTGGTVSAASFGASTALPSLASIPGGTPYLSEVMLVDVDSDGKLDAVATTANNTQGFLAVFKNTSTTGTISFAAPLYFPYAYYSALTMTAGDLDGDGRTDFAMTTGTSPGNVFICQNLSTPGNIDFAYGGTISGVSTSGYSDIVIGDLTGDGLPEIVCPGYNAATLSIYQNNSTSGFISMGTVFTIPASVAYTVQLAMADLDADNKMDMVWSVYGAQYVYFTKNIYAGGAFDATAFSATMQVPNKLSNPAGITVGDINSDGKPDVVMSGYTDLTVLQNVGTAGNLNATSFLPTTLFQGSLSSNVFGLSPGVADLDGDNKPEAFFVSSGGALPAGATGIYVFHNESFPVPKITSTSPSSAIAVTTVSLNGNLMYTGNVNPVVRLNKTMATLNGTATNTLASITTPTNGITGKFSVTNHGLTGFSPLFKSTFTTSRNINSLSFATSINFAIGFGPRDVLDVADFDDDGKTDAIISDNTGVRIFQNVTAAGQPITSGSLTELGTAFSSGANSLAYDIDGDNKIDLNTGAGILQNTSSASISFAASVNTSFSNPNGMATADFNKDGKVDLAMTNGTSNVLIVENRSSTGTFVNNGNLSTYYPTSTNLAHPTSKAFGAGNQCVVAADFDGDGYEDVAATSSSDNSFTFFKNLAVYGPITSSLFSTGTSMATASQPYGLTANDFDGDGKVDIAIVHYNATAINVYLNTSTVGSISFAAPINLSGGQTFGYNIGSQDLDGDGKPEIVSTRNPNPGTPSFSVFQNNSTPGTLNFGAAVVYSLTRDPQALAFADINSDQKPDILIVASASGANALMVFENKIGLMPTITSFTPASGPVGTTVTITGTNFSTTPSGNVVKFNGTTAHVIASTATSIDVTVPAGATTGLITVSVSGNTATSATNFTVTAFVPFGNTITSNGTTDFVQVADATALRPLNLTLEAYVNFSSIPANGFCPIINKVLGTAINDSYQLFYLNGFLKGTVMNALGQNTIVQFAFTPTFGRWYHVAFTFDNTSKTQSLYLDGVLVGSNIAVAAPDYDNSAIYVGGDFDNLTTHYSFSGSIDELRIWNIARSQTEIESTISTTLTGSEAGLMAYYKMDETGAGAGITTANRATATGATLNGLTFGSACTPYFTLPSITSFTPSSALIGATVTITGTNFDPVPGNNIVKFNGTTSAVTASTTTSITTTVPVGATNGPVSVSIGGCTPSISATNFTLTATITVTTQPSDFIACSGDLATFSTVATGTTNMVYQWEYSPDGIAPFADLSNTSNYSNTATATLLVNTVGSFGAGRYRCKIDGDFAATVFTNDEGLFVNPVPTAPTTQGASGCQSTALTVNALGGANGNYRWYTAASGGTAISGEVNSGYITPVLTTTTTYYVSISNGSCESTRIPVIATINNCSAPVITSEPLATQIGGKVTLDLKPLIATTNLDISSLQIITPPSSGAMASIDAEGILTIDYTGKNFAGQENITIKACDLNGECATQDFNIEVAGDIVVYNGISPNGANPKLILQYIHVIPETKNNTVYIFDRWENLVWHGSNYDNAAVVFTGVSDGGSALPSGVYFYKIDFTSGQKSKTGFISLRRQ